jgi:hypothetical protein
LENVSNGQYQSEHKSSVRKNEKNVVGQHFNSPGYSLDNLKIRAIEKVFKGLSINNVIVRGGMGGQVKSNFY